MDPSRFRRLMDVVGAALELPPHERDAWLASACADDDGLLDEARELVTDADATSLDAATRLVEAVVGAAAVDAMADEDVQGDPPLPDRIGPYEIVRMLGRGGMGVVYLARQHDPLRRDVALKVVRPGVVDRGALARFAAERRALARMQHPNIAQLFDAGATDDGLPYFAMELVEGPPITEYCAGEALDLDRRLALFRTVCRAVQHAHLRGVIHRDLKPSNVLVVPVDGVPTPKIIDFGIAKAVDGLLSDESLHTRVGSLVGTLSYMSPEQVRGDDGGVDVRSDVYSLGVILYELVSGRHPFEDATRPGMGLLEAQRAILETDPPRPSTGPRATGERNRPAAARGRVQQDLDWVVMKALDKDRERRYQTALDLARDLERYAAHEPVSAGPPSLAYRARKFVRRNRLAVAAAGVVMVALLTGAALAARGYVRATAEARRAEAVSTFLTDMLASPRPDRQGLEVTVREVLDEAAGRLDAGSFSGDPETEATLALVIGHSLQSLGYYPESLPVLRRSAALRQELHDETDPRIYESLYRLATALWHNGNLDEAAEMRVQLAELTRRTVGPDHADYAEALSNLGNTYADMGESRRADEYLTQAVEIGRRLEGDEGELNLARFLNNRGTVLFDLERYAEAIERYHESLDIRRRLLGERAPVYAQTLSNLGNAQTRQGDLEGAEATHRRAVELQEELFGDAHPTTATGYGGLAEVFRRQGHLDEAEDYTRRALAIREATAGDAYWRIAGARRQLATILMDQGRLDEAGVELETAWAGLVATGAEATLWGRQVADVREQLEAKRADGPTADGRAAPGPAADPGGSPQA
jgi:serine/threonine protein kinase/Tfp pilus assembly protein PilF